MHRVRGELVECLDEIVVGLRSLVSEDRVHIVGGGVELSGNTVDQFARRKSGDDQPHSGVEYEDDPVGLVFWIELGLGLVKVSLRDLELIAKV